MQKKAHRRPSKPKTCGLDATAHKRSKARRGLLAKVVAMGNCAQPAGGMAQAIADIIGVAKTTRDCRPGGGGGARGENGFLDNRKICSFAAGWQRCAAQYLALAVAHGSKSGIHHGVSGEPALVCAVSHGLRAKHLGLKNARIRSGLCDAFRLRLIAILHFKNSKPTFGHPPALAPVAYRVCASSAYGNSKRTNPAGAFDCIFKNFHVPHYITIV